MFGIFWADNVFWGVENEGREGAYGKYCVKLVMLVLFCFPPFFFLPFYLDGRKFELLSKLSCVCVWIPLHFPMLGQEG